MIEPVEIVAHGRPAAVALAALVAQAKQVGPLAPVTVVVPSNFAGLSARRLLASGQFGPAGIANVGFLTPFRLAELLAVDRLGDRRPLTNPVLASAVRRALATDAGPFAEVADHLATERALAALYAELSHVSPPGLDALERCGGAAAQAVRQHRNIAARLGAFYHEDDVAEAAAGRPDLPAALGPFGRLVWYLPEPATPSLTRFLAAAFAAVPSAAVVGLTGDPEADVAVVATCRRVGVDVPPDAGDVVAPPVGSHVVSVSDPDEEVRAVVRRIAELATVGVPLDRIGVFHPTPDPYLRTLRQQLAAAGIPANGPAQDRLADCVAGRTLLAALALPGERWRRDRVMALISGAPLRHQGRPARPASWEGLSRRAGVVQDLADWRHKLSAHAQGEAERLAGAEEPVEESRRQLVQRLIDDAGRLASFVEELAAGVGAVGRAASWADRSAAARQLLVAMLGDGNDRRRWPEAEQDGFDRVEDALARLATLDELEPDPTFDVFRRALTAELDVRRGRSGRFGEGVVYGPLSGAVGQDLDAVFVLGLAEGTCPAPRRDDAMLPEVARAAAGDDLPLRSRALHDQHRWFLAALAAAPPERRWLLHPRGDLRGGRNRLPSRWLLPTVSARAGRTVYSTEFHDVGAPAVEVVPSFAAGLRTAPVAASATERDLAALLTHVDRGGLPASHPVATPVAAGLEAQADRRSARYTRWDGNLAGLPVASPATTGQVLSASRLETWAGCGFKYYLSYVLGLSDREDPERIVELSALDLGSLVHEVLERFFREVIDAGAPAPDQRWTEPQRERLHAIAREVCEQYERRGVTGRPVRWRLQQEQLHATLDDFLRADEAFRAAARSRPARVEQPFGFEGVPPVVVELSDGRQVRFRGWADRVDITESGRHVVLDYKTGKGDKYRKLFEDPVLAGRTLQLGLYSEAAHQILGGTAAGGHYWLVNDQGCDERHGYDWTGEHRARFVEVIEAIVDGIEAGSFPAVPGEFQSWSQRHENCTYCEFHTICPVERGEQALAKEAAPEVQVRLRLAVRTPEPDEREDQP